MSRNGPLSGLRRASYDVMIVGGYPPPYGGVSVHCQRLAAALSARLDVLVIDSAADTRPGWDPAIPMVYRVGAIHDRPTRAWRLLMRIARTKSRIAHFHAGSFDNFALLALPLIGALPRGTRRLVTIHSGSFPMRVTSASAGRRRLMAAVLRQMDCVVCVSAAIAEQVRALAPDVRTEVVPAYLPAPAEPDPVIDEAIERLRDRGVERVCVAAGFARPYYGFHTVLDAVAEDESLRGRVGLIFAFYTEYEAAYHAKVAGRLEELGGIAFDNLTPEQFAYLLGRADTFLRPTDRDGDSVALREARALGKQIVASDCVTRPGGSILFRAMDPASLREAMHVAVANRDAGTGREDADANWRAMKRIYRSLGAPL